MFCILPSAFIEKIKKYFNLCAKIYAKIYWEKEISVSFYCYKCKRINIFSVKVPMNFRGGRVALNCKFCISLDKGSEVATVNMVFIKAKTDLY